jgi:hypothetical protein
MRLFKGAAPGTHWALNDARATGFHSAPGIPPGPGDAVRHIAIASHSSPWVSLTASYAVAFDYASPGATAATVGYVYEIDTSRATKAAPLKLFDPIAIIARLGQHHDHNGAQDLILGVAAPSLHGGVLTAIPMQLVRPPIGARYSEEFQALVFALRDAEFLAQIVPSGCIVARHQIP